MLEVSAVGMLDVSTKSPTPEAEIEEGEVAVLIKT